MSPQTDRRLEIVLKILICMGIFTLLAGIWRVRGIALRKSVPLEGAFVIEGHIVLRHENPEILKKNLFFLKPTRFDTQDLDGSVYALIGQEVRCQAEFAPTSRDRLDGSTLKLSGCTKMD